MADSILDKLPLPPREIPEVYFEAPKNRYWLKHGTGFTPFGREDFILRLNVLGYSRKRSKEGNASEAEEFISDLHLNAQIDYAGEIAGQSPGFLQLDNKRLLVTAAPKLLTPAAGDWGTIRFIADRLVGSTQMPYFLGWHKYAVETIYTKEKKAGQMLVLAGAAGCGKSLWQNRVITPLLGGRMAKPVQYMNGGTTFNEDIIRAEHLMLEDESSSMDLRSRRALGSAIKNFTVNRQQRIHAKGKTAFTAPSWHRVSLSVNDEPENLSILPPLDDSIRDKLMVLHCSDTFVYPDGIEGNQQELEVRLTQELPAFLWYLLNEYRVASEDQDLRYGVRAYSNPEITDTINGLAPETELLQMIDDLWFREGCSHQTRTVTAAEVQQALLDEETTNYRARKVFSFISAGGWYLGRLAKSKPERVVCLTHSAGRAKKWRISPP